EAADAMIQFGQSWPKLMDVAGDIVVKAMNWPGADDIAARITKTIPQNLNEGEDGQSGPPAIPPEVQQQLVQLQEALKQAQEDADKNRADIRRAEISAQAQVEAAKVTANSRENVEELSGLVKLLLAKMPPPPALVEEVSEDFAGDSPQGSEQVPRVAPEPPMPQEQMNGPEETLPQG
ncbi:MAG: hypothetical protein ACRC8N_14945, partial [Aeromonas veronii]